MTASVPMYTLLGIDCGIPLLNVFHGCWGSGCDPGSHLRLRMILVDAAFPPQLDHDALFVKPGCVYCTRYLLRLQPWCRFNLLVAGSRSDPLWPRCPSRYQQDQLTCTACLPPVHRLWSATAHWPRGTSARSAGAHQSASHQTIARIETGRQRRHSTRLPAAARKA